MGNYERIEKCPGCKKDITILDRYEEIGVERECPFCHIVIVLECDEFLDDEGNEYNTWEFKITK